jgi:hypothetical protein
MWTMQTNPFCHLSLKCTFVAMENKHDEMVKRVEELQSTKDQLM